MSNFTADSFQWDYLQFTNPLLPDIILMQTRIFFDYVKMLNDLAAFRNL